MTATPGGGWRLRAYGIAAHPYLLLACANLFWAGNQVVGKSVLDQVPPFALGFWRWALALLILLPLAGPELVRAWPVIRRHGPYLLACGLMAVTAWQALIYLALQRTLVLNILLINALGPLLIMGAAWAMAGERMSARQALGGLLGLLGALAIVTQADPARLLALEFQSGDLLALAGQIIWAVYSIMLRRRPAGLTPLGFATSTAVFGTLGLVPFELWEHAQIGGFALTWPIVAALAYLAVFPSVLSLILWNRGVAAVGAGPAGQTMYLIPLFGAVLSMVFLGERLAWHHAIGIALIAPGVWLASRAAAK